MESNVETLQCINFVRPCLLFPWRWRQDYSNCHLLTSGNIRVLQLLFVYCKPVEQRILGVCSVWRSENVCDLRLCNWQCHACEASSVWLKWSSVSGVTDGNKLQRIIRAEAVIVKGRTSPPNLKSSLQRLETSKEGSLVYWFLFLVVCLLVCLANRCFIRWLRTARQRTWSKHIHTAIETSGTTRMCIFTCVHKRLQNQE